MGLGWTGLIPLSMFNVVVTGFGILIDQPILAGIGGVVIMFVGLVVNDALSRKKKIA
jgi:hypothetical protein